MKKVFTYSEQIFLVFIVITGTILLFADKASAQTKHVVEVTNNKFTPDELVIAAGDTVEWRNLEGYHNVNGNKGTYPENPESFGNNPGNGWIYSHIFTIPGKYDYQCDPHAGLGMNGKLEVKDDGTGDDGDKHLLTINFSDMNPHDGQNLYLRVYEKNSGKEVVRKKENIHPAFNIAMSGIEKNHSYFIDFFADHNQNGMYDAPPTDHAWRLELNDVMGDTTLNFTHNTNFSDIIWQNRLTVHFTGMNPHVGQNFWVGLVNQESGVLSDSIKTTVAVDFMVHFYGIEIGKSYHIDFYADHNQNGMYDAPPTDHAWRIELNNVTGDTTLNFAHNINFTDIFVTTSISGIHLDRLKMYPNPATDIVSIETDEQNMKDLTFSVYDISGKLMQIETIRSNNKFVFSVLHLNRGIYFIELKNKSLRETMKLIKN